MRALLLLLFIVALAILGLSVQHELHLRRVSQALMYMARGSEILASQAQAQSNSADETPERLSLLLDAAKSMGQSNFVFYILSQKDKASWLMVVTNNHVEIFPGVSVKTFERGKGRDL